MEIKINKPTKYVNGMQFFDETGFSYYQLANDFYINGEATEAALLAAFAAHNPTPPAEPTVAEKLAAAGLTVNELKAALGL